MTFSPVVSSHQDRYTDAMAKSLSEKLFFADRVTADIWVDFGCADGRLLESLGERHPNSLLVGYDLCENSLAKTKERTGAAVFSKWDELLAFLAHFPTKTIGLIASSVLHEVYAYGGQTEGELFWSRLASGPFTTFILRDMTISQNQAMKLNRTLAQKVRSKASPYHLQSFEDTWGSITIRQNMIHFLLKYRYTENWTRELTENYLPIFVESIQSKLSSNFRIDFQTREVLPFLSECVKNDFDVAFPCTSHIKLIAHRR
jgi:hypothetical protein